MSSLRHAVILLESLTGEGNVPAFTILHKVAAENGNTEASNFFWRMKPIAGKSTGVRLLVDIPWNLMKLVATERIK